MQQDRVEGQEGDVAGQDGWREAEQQDRHDRGRSGESPGHERRHGPVGEVGLEARPMSLDSHRLAGAPLDGSPDESPGFPESPGFV